MQELSEPPLVPSARVNGRVLTDLVKPLLEYLDALENNSEERKLTWEEDQRAIAIAKGLVPKEEYPNLSRCIEDFCAAKHRNLRTLCQWYLYSRHVARHLYRGE